MLKRSIFRCKTVSASVLALTTSLVMTACTNPTSTAGKVSYFTEGVITDVEYITIDLNQYDTTKSGAVGAAAGAAVGQVATGNSKGTLIGAGIGALVGGATALFMDRTSDGARLTVSTNQGQILVDQPFSCNFRKGAKIRMIKQSNNEVQVQVLVNGSYRTAEKNSPKECPL